MNRHGVHRNKQGVRLWLEPEFRALCYLVARKNGMKDFTKQTVDLYKREAMRLGIVDEHMQPTSQKHADEIETLAIIIRNGGKING